MPMTADYLAYHCEPLSRIIYFAYYGAVKVYNLDGPYPKAKRSFSASSEARCYSERTTTG